MFSAVAKGRVAHLSTPPLRTDAGRTDTDTDGKKACLSLYIDIMIIYACFQPWRQEQVDPATRKVKLFFHEREVSIYQWHNW